MFMFVHGSSGHKMNHDTSSVFLRVITASGRWRSALQREQKRWNVFFYVWLGIITHTRDGQCSQPALRAPPTPHPVELTIAAAATRKIL